MTSRGNTKKWRPFVFGCQVCNRTNNRTTNFDFLEVCHPCCVCENWKGYVFEHNYVIYKFIICLYILEVCHPRCVCENWKGYVVEHNSVN